MNTNFLAFGLTRPGIKLKSKVSIADVLSSLPLLIALNGVQPEKRVQMSCSLILFYTLKRGNNFLPFGFCLINLFRNKLFTSNQLDGM